ncbi:hypothetical protein [Opitutus terrae]|nr:hypothetical protein [Opitutus terrae]
MPRLFSYTMAHDDGAGPNPFRGICTLAICKPKIRQKAVIGDWVVGLGSVNAPSGDLSQRMVYAMRVDQLLSMRDYDRLAPVYWPSRIPDLASPVIADRLGDCVYDFSQGAPVQRPSVHGPEHMATDLSGQNVLVSRHYFCLGSNALALPESLSPIVHQTQSHKVNANDRFVEPFMRWIQSLRLDPGHIYGWPDGIPKWIGGKICRKR